MRDNFNKGGLMKVCECTFNYDHESYIIKNVPYQIYNREKFYGASIVIKLLLLQDLMIKEEIPKVIDFNTVRDI